MHKGCTGLRDSKAPRLNCTKLVPLELQPSGKTNNVEAFPASVSSYRFKMVSRTFYRASGPDSLLIKMQLKAT